MSEANKRSPLGYFYKYDPQAPAGVRLVRRRWDDFNWEVGQPEFSVQLMPAAELRHIADVIDAATSNEVA